VSHLITEVELVAPLLIPERKLDGTPAEELTLSINPRATPCVTLAAIVIAALASVRCGSSPTAPSGTPAVSGITLNANSIAAGSSSQGTVTLTSPASAGGTSISLSSSNPAVVTVQTPLMIPAGSTTEAFTVKAVGIGTATITASLNGVTRQSSSLTVTPGAAVSSLSLSASSIVGGNSVIGTVGLTAAAPAGGASVSLSGGDPATVPASVAVAAGSTSATFTITTRAVGGTIPATITASYGGGSASAVLSVTRVTVATASFGVTGPTETDTCTLTNGGNTINCTFNGSTSAAPGNITAYDWSYAVAKTFAQTTTGPVLAMPAVDCSLLPPPPLPAGTTWFAMTVKLKIHDDQGNVSAEATSGGVRLFPDGTCGY
jgi:hypothetical protein